MGIIHIHILHVKNENWSYIMLYDICIIYVNLYVHTHTHTDMKYKYNLPAVTG